MKYVIVITCEYFYLIFYLNNYEKINNSKARG